LFLDVWIVGGLVWWVGVKKGNGGCGECNIRQN
jgi:hypothetical protein